MFALAWRNKCPGRSNYVSPARRGLSLGKLTVRYDQNYNEEGIPDSLAAGSNQLVEDQKG